jgi:hypothetical protein
LTQYVDNFVLLGIPKPEGSDSTTDFFPRLVDDLKAQINNPIFPLPSPFVKVVDSFPLGLAGSSAHLRDHVHTYNYKPTRKSSCIIADTTRWRCDLVCCNFLTSNTTVLWNGRNFEGVSMSEIPYSELIFSMLKGVGGLWEMGLPAETCVLYLEDRLHELWSSSRLLAQYIHARGDLPFTKRPRSLSASRTPPNHDQTSSPKPNGAGVQTPSGRPSRKPPKASSLLTFAELSKGLGLSSRDLDLMLAIASAEDPAIIEYIAPEETSLGDLLG